MSKIKSFTELLLKQIKIKEKQMMIEKAIPKKFHYIFNIKKD